jgi:predicted phosphoadenosine phosphosulfate sulfurtransferase
VLARKDGAAASEWATKLPPGAARKQAISQVTQEWAQREPGAAGDWIHTMPAGSERDEALVRFTQSDRDW